MHEYNDMFYCSIIALQIGHFLGPIFRNKIEENLFFLSKLCIFVSYISNFFRKLIKHLELLNIDNKNSHVLLLLILKSTYVCKYINIIDH